MRLLLGMMSASEPHTGPVVLVTRFSLSVQHVILNALTPTGRKCVHESQRPRMRTCALAVGECRELEECFGTNYTDTILAGADGVGMREIKRVVRQADRVRQLEK